jgi:glutathione S-transferase
MPDRPSFTLYHFPATRSARVKWVLHELLGDAFDVELVPLYHGAQYMPEYLAKNPNHNVPMLEIGFPDGTSTRMLESGAMVAFLADAFPEQKLAPPPSLTSERADYLQMLHFATTWMDMMLWQIRCHEHLLPEAEVDQRTIARYRRKFQVEVEPQLAERLGRTSFICGSDFTAADCVIGHDVMWAKAYGLCRTDVFSAYAARLGERTAFRKAFADLSDFSPELPAEIRAVGRFTG